MRRAVIPLLILFPLQDFSAGETQSTSRDESLQRIEDALAEDEGLDPKTKKALEDLVDVLRADGERATGRVSGDEPPEEASLWEKFIDAFTLYGDARFRYESSFELDDKADRHRARLRLRLGATYRLLDEVAIGARLVTGDREDPNSPHVTLGDGLKNLEISLDRAFINYRPSRLEGAYLTGGKFGHPFYANPVYGELVWDADVQPEGIVAGYSLPELGPMASLRFTAGGYILEERSSVSDSFLPVVQAAGRFEVSGDVSATAAVGYYWYTNVDTSLLVEDNAGNGVVDTDGDGSPDEYDSEFGILNPILAFTYSGWDLPVTLSAEYVLNTETGAEDNEGWAAGMAVGSTRAKGDWRFYYQFQVIEQDAVFSAFAQDDFLFATNHRSHLFGINYQFVDEIGIHVWGLVSQRDETFSSATADSDKGQWRVRADLNIRL